MHRILATPLVLAVLTVGAPSRAEPRPLLLEEERLVALVNEARVEAGLEPVVVDAQLCEVARSHSRDMIEQGYFDHVSPRTGTPGDRLRAAGLAFRLSGENIAIDQSVDRAHAAFLASPGHRRNVLDPEMTHLGVGIVPTERGLFVTEHFVLPRPGFVAIQPPPSSSSPTEAGAEPLLTETDPSPLPCGRCDAPATDAGPAAGVAEAPPLLPAPVFAAPMLPSWPAPLPPPPTRPAEVWVMTPAGWQLVPAPWLVVPSL